MDADRLKSELRQALGGAFGLPAADVDSVTELIHVGEWELALDTLCTQTYEYDLAVSEEQRSLLVRLGHQLDVPVPYLLGEAWASAPASSWRGPAGQEDT